MHKICGSWDPSLNCTRFSSFSHFQTGISLSKESQPGKNWPHLMFLSMRVFGKIFLFIDIRRPSWLLIMEAIEFVISSGSFWDLFHYQINLWILGVAGYKSDNGRFNHHLSDFTILSNFKHDWSSHVSILIWSGLPHFQEYFIIQVNLMIFSPSFVRLIHMFIWRWVPK